MRYAYFPGCSLLSTARAYDLSARVACRALGIGLEEIPDWNCCGATSAHSLSRDLGIALPLRNLALAEAMGLDILAPCAACYNRLKSADAAIKGDPVMAGEMLSRCGLSYRGTIRVLSLLEAMTSVSEDALRSAVKRDLAGWKPACYYGCLLLRPPEIARFDDPENPSSMERILSALGAGPVEWPYRTECCGASLSLSRPDIVVRLTRDILSMAKRAGADCIVTACPLCQGNLEMRQPAAEAGSIGRFGLPVFYLSQVMGIAFGLSASDLALGQMLISPSSLMAAAR
ncbi:MAG: CoB--CoM heterodisulfide reductase iron-sulfur subunit B family protein [Armatimonadetes bacterium]|nr:CoB--CoM heterodisulfide reductase iron-sulfur subunit B family protein [Armatimonadota bacterium]